MHSLQTLALALLTPGLLKPHLWCMSDGWSVGGAAEADAAYEEAFDAIFNLAVESYRHPIPQISKKNGQQKWSMIEMWPMTVSASAAAVHLLHPFHFFLGCRE